MIHSSKGSETENTWEDPGNRFFRRWRKKTKGILVLKTLLTITMLFSNGMNSCARITKSRIGISSIAGCITGILGIVGLYGFLAYFLSYGLIVVMLSLKMNFQTKTYFQSTSSLISDGLFQGFMVCFSSSTNLSHSFSFGCKIFFISHSLKFDVQHRSHLSHFNLIHFITSAWSNVCVEYLIFSFFQLILFLPTVQLDIATFIATE